MSAELFSSFSLFLFSGHKLIGERVIYLFLSLMVAHASTEDSRLGSQKYGDEKTEI